MAWLQDLLRRPGRLFAAFVWPHGTRALQALWGHCMLELGIEHIGYTLAGLRGGGTTYDYLCHGNIPRLRWRGVWRQEPTLENYLLAGKHGVAGRVVDLGGHAKSHCSARAYAWLADVVLQWP